MRVPAPLKSPALLPALLSILTVTAHPAGATELRNRLLTGYDSFIDRFTLVEDDTTETIHEYYVGMENFLLSGSGADLMTLRNIFKYGNQTVDNDLSGTFNAGSRDRLKAQLRGDLRLKMFREGSDYSLGNDYWQSNVHLKLGRAFGENIYAASRSRFELVDFEEKTDFDYDYRYFDTGLLLEAGSYFNRFIRIAGSIGRREAPDTTDMGFDRFLSEGEVRASSGPVSVELTSMADRRQYDGTARSDYWFVYTTGGATWTRTGGMAVTARLESELLYYDTESRTWFDNHYVRGSLRWKVPAADEAHFYAEPRIAALRCGSFIEERYSEWSVILGLDILGNEDYWLTLYWEPGYRSYNLEDNPIYSDFRINRLQMMGSGKLADRFSVNLFVSHDPEKHTRRTDDFSITMVSVSLSADF